MKSLKEYPKVIWLLAIGMTINVTGMSFLWPLNTLYITGELGKSMFLAGVILMLQQAFGIIGNLVGGWLFDYQGGKKTIVYGVILSTIFVFSLSFVTKITFYIPLMLLLGFSNGLVAPSMYALSGSLWPEGGRRAFNIVYVAQNLGVALGSVFGGMVAQISFRLVFVVNALMFIVFLMIVLFGFKKDDWQRSADIQLSSTLSNKEKFNFRSPNFIALMFLSAAFIFTWMPYVQWQTSISKFIESIGIPYPQYTILWTINGALIVLGQPIIALVVKALNSTKKQMIVGVLIFMSSFVILYDNTWYYGFVISMIVMTIGEMLVWPAVPAAAQDLAPEGKRGRYQGIVSSAAAGGRMLGFLVGGLLYDLVLMNHIILFMLFLFVLAVIGFINYDKILKTNKQKAGVQS